jgi:hypothetical protein
MVMREGLVEMGGGSRVDIEERVLVEDEVFQSIRWRM